MNTFNNPPATLGMHHVALLSRNYEASCTFYKECIGMQVEWEPDDNNVYLTSGNDNLAIHRDSSDEPRGPTQLDHIGFIVADMEGVDTWYEHIKKLGIPVANPPKTHRDGARSFYVFDPDGVQVQIIYHPPLSR